MRIVLTLVRTDDDCDRSFPPPTPSDPFEGLDGGQCPEGMTPRGDLAKRCWFFLGVDQHLCTCAYEVR